MDSLLALPYFLDCLFLILGAASVFEVIRYRRRFDTTHWTGLVNRTVDRVRNDPAASEARIREIDAEMAALPARPPEPIRKERDIQFRTYPTIMLCAVVAGIVLLYIGMFHSLPKSGVRWHLFAGLGLMAATLILYFHLWRHRGPFFRARLLHEKYRIQKTSDRPERLQTLGELLRYYPEMPGLWMEYAHEQFVLGEHDAARESLRRIEELLPNSPEPGVLLARFHLRKTEYEKAGEALAQAEEHTNGANDARILLLRGAVALAAGDQISAEKLYETALSVDGDTAEMMLNHDETLSPLAVFRLERLEQEETARWKSESGRWKQENEPK